MESIISAIRNESGYVAFFDLDRTISAAISGRSLAKEAVRRGLMKLPDILNAIFLGVSYRLGTGDSAGIMEKMTGWVKGIPVSLLNDICITVTEKVMIPAIHKEVYRELEMHRSAGARTVILSSTLVPVCKAVADYLKMDDIIASELEIKDNHLTGRPVGRLCYGDEKMIRLRMYCEKNNTAVSLAWYYADALIDYPALRMVGVPVCVNPDRKLRRIADKNGWRIYRWR